MSLDRLISVANAYKGKVPHAAAKSLKMVLDEGEPVEVGSITIENDADGCVLTLTTKEEGEGKAKSRRGKKKDDDAVSE